MKRVSIEEKGERNGNEATVGAEDHQKVVRGTA